MIQAIELNIKGIKDLVKKQKSLDAAFDFGVQIKGTGYIPAKRAKSLNANDGGFNKEKLYVDEALFFNPSAKGVHVEYYSYGVRRECYISKLDFSFSFWAQKKYE